MATERHWALDLQLTKPDLGLHTVGGVTCNHSPANTHMEVT